MSSYFVVSYLFEDSVFVHMSVCVYMSTFTAVQTIILSSSMITLEVQFFKS